MTVNRLHKRSWLGLALTVNTISPGIIINDNIKIFLDVAKGEGLGTD